MGKRQTYYVFESAPGYVVMSASRTKRASGYFNLVSRDAVNRIRKSYAGKQDVTAKQLATRSRSAGVRDALQALNILYVLVATGAAKRDDRHQDTRLHFNIARALTARLPSRGESVRFPAGALLDRRGHRHVAPGPQPWPDDRGAFAPSPLLGA